jgi:hypothetical protein
MYFFLTNKLISCFQIQNQIVQICFFYKANFLRHLLRIFSMLLWARSKDRKVQEILNQKKKKQKETLSFEEKKKKKKKKKKKLNIYYEGEVLWSCAGEKMFPGGSKMVPRAIILTSNQM